MKKTIAAVTLSLFSAVAFAQAPAKPADKKEPAKEAVKTPPPPNIPAPKHETKPVAKPAAKPAEKKEAKK